MMLSRTQRRTGTVLVESAMVYPVLFLVVLGIMILGISVFRHQQVSHMAREAARYAVVKGARYAEENAATAASATDIYNNAIVPHAAGMNLSNLTYSVTWTDSNTQSSSVVVTDASGNSSIQTRFNTVTVTVQYSWTVPIWGEIPVSSTHVMTMCY